MDRGWIQRNKFSNKGEKTFSKHFLIILVTKIFKLKTNFLQLLTKWQHISNPGSKYWITKFKDMLQNYHIYLIVLFQQICKLCNSILRTELWLKKYMFSFHDQLWKVSILSSNILVKSVVLQVFLRRRLFSNTVLRVVFCTGLPRGKISMLNRRSRKNNFSMYYTLTYIQLSLNKDFHSFIH